MSLHYKVFLAELASQGIFYKVLKSNTVELKFNNQRFNVRFYQNENNGKHLISIQYFKNSDFAKDKLKFLIAINCVNYNTSSAYATVSADNVLIVNSVLVNNSNVFEDIYNEIDSLALEMFMKMMDIGFLYENGGDEMVEWEALLLESRTEKLGAKKKGISI